MPQTPDPAQLVAAIDGERSGVGARLESALRTAAALRLVADELVDHYVEAARREGLSWTEIGELLGITKQGAQKRFAGPASAQADRWPAGSGADAQAVFAQAVEEARRLGHRHVGTEHLLLALFSERAGLAASCLTRQSVSREDVYARVVQLIGHGENPPDGPLGISPQAKRVFEHARRESRRLGNRCLQPEHLLLALHALSDGATAEILAGFGVGEARTRTTLAELLSREAPELAERLRRPPRRRLVRR